MSVGRCFILFRLSDFQQNYTKATELICTKPGWRTGLRTEQNSLPVGGDPDEEPGPRTLSHFL